MSEPTREDRMRAMGAAIEAASISNTERSNVEVHLLRDCVPVPKDELVRLERALWIGMLESLYPRFAGFTWSLEQVAEDILREAGLLDARNAWTPAAHEFAKRMKEQEDE